jgi:hypothetical protein
MKKDPRATLDYSVDWTEWLAGDTITASQWSISGGPELSITNTSNTASIATVWLTGGTAGKSYRVSNVITTAAGRTDARTLIINVEER